MMRKDKEEATAPDEAEFTDGLRVKGHPCSAHLQHRFHSE